ncbi:MAG: universal stress protein [Peptostreptococcaceae bacterium]|jgi:nucleotide-binding universal stress UspA family protein|nr:universal stress protein [Peptostreptococcaceae bacterium]
MELNRVLVPLDGSKESEKSLEYAIKLGIKFDCEILLLNVVEVYRGTSIYSNYEYVYNKDYEIFRDYSKEILEKAKEKTKDLKVRAISSVGHPAEEIISKAIEEDADLIIMATHGMGGLKRFLIGSVTNNVVHHSKIPVLVLPHKDHD